MTQMKVVEVVVEMVEVVDLVKEVVALDHNQCVRLPPGPAGVLENLLLNNFSDKFLGKICRNIFALILTMMMVSTMMSKYLGCPTIIVSQSQLHHWASTSFDTS